MAGTGTAYPADAVSGAPAYAALQGRNALAAFMTGATTAKPLGGFSGVRPATRTDLITATSSTWTMNALGCAGYIELESSATNSGYFFAFSGTVTGTVSAAEASARVDLVYIQINDSNTSDGSSGAPRVVMDYQKGTAGAGVPTLTAARAFVIAQINVPATGGGSPTVTWVAPYCASAGGILPVISSSFYPAAASYPGLYIDDLATGLLKRSNGTSWLVVNQTDTGWVTPTILTNWTAVSGQTPQYRTLNGVTYLRGSAVGTASSAIFLLPVGSRQSTAQDKFWTVNSAQSTTAVARVIARAATGNIEGVSGTTPQLDGISFPADA
jgi:hypothetical protein